MSITKENISPFMVGTMRLGSWGANFSSSEVQEFIEKCLALDLIDFDFADIYGDYGTEQDFGNVFASSPNLRQKMRITTKCGIKMIAPTRPDHKVKSYDLSAGHIKQSVENSLQYLKTDYLDLLLLHRPDYLMDPSEIAKAFDELKQEGKVLEFGVSNFTPSQFEMLNEATNLITNQVEISLQHRDAFEDGTLDQCMRGNIIPMAWSPLGGGTYLRESDDENITSVRTTASEIGKQYGLEIDQVLLAWLRKHPGGIIPVLGTSKIERIEAALKVLNVELTREEWYTLWQAATGEEIA